MNKQYNSTLLSLCNTADEIARDSNKVTGVIVCGGVDGWLCCVRASLCVRAFGSACVLALACVCASACVRVGDIRHCC